MYEIIQTEAGCEAVIDLKESEAEAEDLVNQLNIWQDSEQISFFYRLSNQFQLT